MPHLNKYWVKLYEADRRLRQTPEEGVQGYRSNPRYYSAVEALDMIKQLESQLEKDGDTWYTTVKVDEAKWPSDIQWWRTSEV